MRTNIEYNGSEDDDSPVHGAALSFEVKDFLHIKEVSSASGVLFSPSPQVINAALAREGRLHGVPFFSQ